VAIAAGHDGVDEITATLDRGFSHGAAADDQQQCASDADPKHDAPHFRKRYIAGRSKPGNGFAKIKAAQLTRM
jgi:hypothetical protein